jgi:hypothetical protein
LAVTAGADVGVIPYRNVGLNNFFTSPNKLFEYCAAGVPVAASRFPELSKVVEGPAGRTDVRSGRPGQHRRGRPRDRGRSGRAGALSRERGRAAAGFSWEREVEALHAVYDSLPVEA